MNKFFLLVTLLLLSFTACSQQAPVARNPKPSWTINPNEDGNIGAVGVASRTHDQKISTQRKYAITRALEELSLQQGVKVNLRIKKKETLNNGRVNKSMNVDSSFETTTTVTAHIKSAWQDKSTSEIYVWMVMD